MTASHSLSQYPSITAQNWHTESLETVLTTLDSNPEAGLTQEEAHKRLNHYGKNELQERKGRTQWEILLDQFKNIMLIMLIGVAVVSGILDIVELTTHGSIKTGIPFKDTIAILTIVILNGILGFLQESRAEKALSALKKLSPLKVRVIRENHPQEINSEDITIGDIMLVEAGGQICADGRLLEAINLQVRESALTGEAHAVHKIAETQGFSEDTPVGDRLNMVFTGTEIIQGRGKVLITGVGMNTQLGKIAQMLQSVENEPTPLQQRMTQLGNVLVTGSLILVIFVVGIGLLKAGNWSPLQELVEVSLSMAVAVVPEGLPAVITVTLAIGTQRMVKRKALIRRLPAVETLGSVDTICSDKTGTLTQNKMVVQEIQTTQQQLKVTGDGYEPVGEFLLDGNEPIIAHSFPTIQGVLIAGVMCNDALLNYDEKDQEWSILGDPTEGALLVVAGKGGINQNTLQKELPRIAEIPFTSERKRMSVICKAGDMGEKDYDLFVKGSPELVLAECREFQDGNHTYALTPEIREKILKDNEAMAQRGLRILGFAYKPLDAVNWQEIDESHERELIWLGLVGMMDAIRPEVKLAVERCRSAGIRPVMITGDHQLTARSIAEQLGIAGENDLLLTGQELEKMSQEELEARVDRTSIYARVSPEHKLRIVQALQKEGHFVAMTGDGVNDAPALKQADIGIAMGITGTDVSKEASDMVLLDDNFASIVAATEEGRVVYNNIRSFIRYILGSNVGEVLTIASAPLLGLGSVPLTPLQILWMNLVTDGIPALALALEPASPDVMERRPFSPKESIFARGLGSYIIRIGIIFAIVTITLMLWSFQESHTHNDPETWKTMVFTSLCIAQMGHAIAARSSDKLTLEMNFFSNPALLWAVAITTLLQLALIYVPFLRSFFDTHLLTGEELLICLGFSSIMFVWVEMEKLLIRWYSKRK